MDFNLYFKIFDEQGMEGRMGWKESWLVYSGFIDLYSFIP